ncbi:hypothetical protein C8R44DRAFT_756050 [Mycena epipterygia]|nr:hypothetical protein C8R44DRAFT_756050 [Mycena epipterygia]
MFSTMLNLKSTYAQITLNRVTVAFFLFSLVHCFSQGIIHSFLFSIDSEFAGMVTKIVHAAEIPLKNMTYLEGSSNQYLLRMCNNIPYELSASPCMVIFQSGHNIGNETEAADASRSLSIVQDFSQGFSISTNTTNNGSGVTLQSDTADPVPLDEQCTQILVYPQQVLQNSVREDTTFIFMQFWLFGVSLFAVSQSSVPHTLTAFGTRVLLTSWSVYIASFRTNNQKTIFHQLVSAAGTPCGVELFPTYFGMRRAYDIADAVLSCTALLLSGLLSWNLLKVYNAQSFKRVGAPDHIIRIYKFFMAVQACLQLEVFVLMAATGLWLNVLTTTSIREISEHTQIYDALILSTAILAIPWIALGWYGIRRENKLMVTSFLAIAFFFIIGWSIMFYSIVYRWTFVQWPYLGCFTVASFVLLTASAILGLICWRNFDKGLAQYLHAEAALASSNFAPEVFEHSDVEKSGGVYPYNYNEPEFPMPTFQSTPRRLYSGSGPLASDADAAPILAPVRGPPPVYDKPRPF